MPPVWRAHQDRPSAGELVHLAHEERLPLQQRQRLQPRVVQEYIRDEGLRAAGGVTRTSLVIRICNFGSCSNCPSRSESKPVRFQNFWQGATRPFPPRRSPHPPRYSTRRSSKACRRVANSCLRLNRITGGARRTRRRSVRTLSQTSQF